MIDRQETMLSRLSVIELRLDQQDDLIKLHLDEVKNMQHDREEMLRILHKLELEQNRTHTILGGITLIGSGIIALSVSIIQDIFHKFIH